MPLDTLLPRNRINLIGGVRDAGKTRWILPAMKTWEAQGNCPPWVYVAADRSILDAQQTIQDMNFKVSDFPIISAYGRDHKSWAQIIDVMMQMEPRPEIVVVEAFQYLSDSINRHQIVDQFMNMVDAYLLPTRQFPNGLTVLGMCGGIKKALRDCYPDPSQRIPGCSTWGERASALFVIESAEADRALTTPNRRMFLCRKHGGLRLNLDGVFDVNNRLIFPSL